MECFGRKLMTTLISDYDAEEITRREEADLVDM